MREPHIPTPGEWLRTKVCARCHEIKPWAQFYPRHYHDDGSVRNVRAYCKPCENRISAGRKQATPLTPEQRERRRATQRKWSRERRRQMRQQNWTRAIVLPAGPFLQWIDRQLMERDTNLLQLGQMAGVPDRTLRRIERQGSVSLDTVDRCATALGWHINEIYPEQETSRAA